MIDAPYLKAHRTVSSLRAKKAGQVSDDIGAAALPFRHAGLSVVRPGFGYSRFDHEAQGSTP